MNEQQLNVIIGLFAGVQTAVVHLANLLAVNANIPRENVAASFSETARSLPPDIANRELTALVLRQISAGIQNSALNADAANEIRRLLH
jgi:hypothetical protein